VIAHVLRFRFKDGISEEDFAASMQAFRRAGQASAISYSVVGQYSGNPADGYTHSAVFGLADLAALETYMYEPAHREADFIVHPHLAKFDAFDISDEEQNPLPCWGSGNVVRVEGLRIAVEFKSAFFVRAKTVA